MGPIWLTCPPFYWEQKDNLRLVYKSWTRKYSNLNYYVSREWFKEEYDIYFDNYGTKYTIVGIV